MEIRKLVKIVYVSSGAQKGWGAESIDCKTEVLQYKDAEGKWRDVPTVSESVNVWGKNDVTYDSSDRTEWKPGEIIYTNAS